MHTTKRLWGLGLIAILVAACSTTGGQASPESPSIASVPPVSQAPVSVAPSATAEADICTAAEMPTVTPGTFTIGTDNPAYPPYFEIVDPPTTDPWELGDPTTGTGFESAFAYALAEELGFDRDTVRWIPVKFDNAYAPGPKDFDVDINQISFTPERAENVDMSDGYYFVNQSVVANKDTPAAEATTLTALKDLRLGAQVGTTSLATIQNVIQPTADPSVYDDNTAAIAALDAKQIDAIVVDLPTAFFITAAQMDNGVIVGQIEQAEDADAEYFSAVLPKDSPLTDCVNQAIAAMQSDGRLDAITQEWLSDKANAPVLQP
jgi:polar amino acid transport system substrate-binding protein